MLNIDEITSPLGAQMFDFCDSELFQETLQNNSEVASSSNCCYNEEQSSSYPSSQLSNIITDTTDNTLNHVITATSTTTGNNNLPITFSEDQIIENDISASIDFSTPSPSFSVLNHHHNQQYLNNNQEPFNILHHQYDPPRGLAGVVPPLLGPPPIFEDECGGGLGTSSYMRLRNTNTCGLMDPMIHHAPYLPFSSADNGGGFFGGSGLMMGNHDQLCHQTLDFEGDGGIFLPDNNLFNGSTELRALSSESQHLVHGGASSTTPLASDISSLEDPTFKVGKLSVEERKRKIHRYMKKRNERNFSKKIKYACRKTLADSRPRVRGRFAKNDELGELGRNNGVGTSLEQYDTDEDLSLYSNSMPDHQNKVMVKEEDLDSADIFAHLSGVNSFKCNYPIQSWI